MIGGVPGGRSTHGICYGILSWLVEEGRVDDTDVSGLAAALVYRYDDDESGSPWSLVLHVDGHGDEHQRAALEDVFLGRLGGARVGVLPWVRKASKVIDVRSSAISLVPEGDGYALQVGGAARARATQPVETDQPIACIVPGYDRVGAELYADDLIVDDEPFEWELAGNCAYAADFEYSS
jgi:hypothetical protein